MTHPRGLYVLAGMEGWERNSFYLMLTLLAYYCNEKLGLSKADSLGLVGSYMGFVKQEWRVFKHKSFLFGVLEGYARENNEVEAEEIENQEKEGE